MNTLREGMTGPDVQRWQTTLNITADGAFGPQTTAATKAFQIAHGLPDDGIVGPLTQAAAGLAPEYSGTGTRVVAQTPATSVKKPVAPLTQVVVAKPSLLTTVKNKLPSFPILLAVSLLGVGLTAAIYKASK